MRLEPAESESVSQLPRRFADIIDFHFDSEGRDAENVDLRSYRSLPLAIIPNNFFLILQCHEGRRRMED